MRFFFEDNEYDLVDPDKWTTREAILVHQASGAKPAEIVADFLEGGPLGTHALAWVSLRRAGKDTRWDELDLPWLDTLKSLHGSEGIQEAPDPLTASTEERKDGRPRRSGTVQSRKK